MQLTQWRVANRITDNMLHKDSALSQMEFVNTHISHMLTATAQNQYMREEPEIVGTHVSKSITLPVYQFYCPVLIGTVKMRENFHNWNVAITCVKPIKIPKGYLSPHHSEYLFWEGMPECENAHPAYPLFSLGKDDQQRECIRFGFSCGGHYERNYELYAILKHIVVQNQ